MDTRPLDRGMTAPRFDRVFVQDICAGKFLPDIANLPLRDPDVFIAGQLHQFPEVWEQIAAFSSYDRAEEVLDWIKFKVSLAKFFKPFKGNFKGVSYDSDIPPSVEFGNNKSCDGFRDFIDKTILERVCSGAISVWGRVGAVKPPHLVLPLTVEPTKPRLCHDNRFLNLWMIDRPFKLDNLSHLPRYVGKGSFQTTLDDKSGYDHILLDEPSRAFFGLQWRGWYFVSNTIPFGWKISAYVYHSTGLLVSHYLRSIGVPCSLYIDDRHNGELQANSFHALQAPTDSEFRLNAAKAAVFLAVYTLTCLGYTLGIKKCVFHPQKKIRYLGFISDSDLQAFYLPVDKQEKFLELVNSILSGNSVSVHTLQRLAGKCISFRLALQDSRLFTNEINLAIGKGIKSSKLIHITPPLRAEIQHWADPSVVARVGNWRTERHHQFVLYSDASLFAWGGVFPKESHVPISDYWPISIVDSDISVKETKALSNTLLSFGDKLRDARVDAYVDNQALVRDMTVPGSPI